MASQQALSTYRLPTHRLRRTMSDPSKTPLVLVLCGSFNPITCLHMRMFEMALDHVNFDTNFEVVGAYVSPVSSAYVKPGLERGEHRLRTCELAVEQETDWVMLDPWEAIQDQYTPTTEVLDHFHSCLKEETISGTDKPITVVLLAGADLIQTMSKPDIWTAEELEHIFSRNLAFVIERSGTDIEDALSSITTWRDRIHVIVQLVQNDVSSTKVRLCLKRRMSVRYLVPKPVIGYIEEHGLYRD